MLVIFLTIQNYFQPHILLYSFLFKTIQIQLKTGIKRKNTHAKQKKEAVLLWTTSFSTYEIVTERFLKFILLKLLFLKFLLKQFLQCIYPEVMVL